MALTGNGSGGYVIPSTGIASASLATPSFHFWYRNTAAPTTSVTDQPFTLADSSATYYFVFSWDHTASAARQAVTGRTSGGSFVDCQFSTSLQADTWYSIGGSYDGTNIRAYLNGALENTAACAAFSSAPTIYPCAFAGQAGTVNFDDGTIAEVAVWNTTLAAADYLNLSKGISPLLVKPGNLVLYWPLIRSVVATRGTALTSSGVTVATHPRMIYGCDPWAIETYIPRIRKTISQSLSLTSTPRITTIGIDADSRLLLTSRFRGKTANIASGRIKPGLDVR